MPRERYDPEARGMFQSLRAPKKPKGKIKELRHQAKAARSLKISARAIGDTGLTSRRSASTALGGARTTLKAAKKGVGLTDVEGLMRHERSIQSHRAPLRKIEQKIRKIARKFDPIAKKKLPIGPRTLLGSFAVPEIVRKMTERVQSLESKGKYKALKEGGYLPKGGGDA